MASASPVPVAIPSLETARGRVGFACFAGALLILVPALNLLPPEEAAIHLPNFIIPLFGKFLCLAMVALAVDLIWGYTGILSLGHGTFFALGGYAMGMHLMRAIGTAGVYRSELPDFMVFLDWKELPWYWMGSDQLWFAILMAMLVPGLLAYVFGWLAFRSRISGVYFSIITQALTYAMMLLFFRNDTGFGGNNGLTDFKTLAGFDLQAADTKVGLYVLSAAGLLGTLLLCRWVVTSKLGRILRAIRDSEDKVRFSGYDTLQFKLFVWTLSAVLCGIAGALYVPQVGIINPSEMEPANSIEIAIWVAVGGRATLSGAVLGAWVVNGAKSVFTVVSPENWLYVLAALFIGVTLLMPRGIVGTLLERGGGRGS